MSVWMGVLGTPALDQMKADWYETEEDRQGLVDRLGAFAQLGFAAAAFNREVRLPVTRLFKPLQGPLGIGQSWYLYLDGPMRITRANILADGELLGRSSDPDYPFLHNKTDYRRMRPFMAAACKSKKTLHWRGTFAWVVREVLAEYPDADVVELRCTVQPLPRKDGSQGDPELRWRMWGTAPAFKPQRMSGEEFEAARGGPQPLPEGTP